MIGMESGIGIALVLAIVGATWKISATLSVIQATMANKTDVALLKQQHKQLRGDLSELWKAFRSCACAINLGDLRDDGS